MVADSRTQGDREVLVVSEAAAAVGRSRRAGLKRTPPDPFFNLAEYNRRLRPIQTTGCSRRIMGNFPIPGCQLETILRAYPKRGLIPSS
jgi:hypothetical protein